MARSTLSFPLRTAFRCLDSRSTQEAIQVYLGYDMVRRFDSDTAGEVEAEMECKLEWIRNDGECDRC